MNYKDKVKELQEQLQNTSGKIGINKKESNLFRQRQDKDKKKLDVSDFNQVISIDADEGTCWVEGMTPFDEFVASTLPHGFMPPVVPQLKSITIGGAVTGLGIESTSFKEGLVHQSLEEIEILLPSGQIVLATPRNKHKDLFFGFPNSYGTLGYALKLKLKLKKTKPFVKLEHRRYFTTEEYFKDLQKFTKPSSEYDFVDGTCFGPDLLILTTAKFVDKAPFVSDYTHLNIYYKSLLKKEVDYLTTQDYLWRWDTDWFWCSEAYGVQNPIIRRIWGKRRLNSRTYWQIRKKILNNPLLSKLLIKKKSREEIIQDIEIPIENCQEWVEFFNSEIGITPFWICPLKVADKFPASLYPMKPRKLYVNFGFWSSVKTDKKPGYYNKLIEKKVTELGGKKSLYSDSYYSKTEFWKLYNKEVYDQLKAKYDPEGRLQDLYQKTVKGH